MKCTCRDTNRTQQEANTQASSHPPQRRQWTGRRPCCSSIRPHSPPAPGQWGWRPGQDCIPEQRDFWPRPACTWCICSAPLSRSPPHNHSNINFIKLRVRFCLSYYIRVLHTAPYCAQECVTTVMRALTTVSINHRYLSTLYLHVQPWNGVILLTAVTGQEQKKG